MEERDKKILESAGDSLYLVIVEPHIRAISQHVYGTNGDPCEACAILEPCGPRALLVGAMDAAVIKWLADQGGELSWQMRVI